MIRTIRFKMIALITVSFVVAALGLGWYFNRLFVTSAARLTRESIHDASAAFADVERSSTELMASMLAALSANPEVRAALASRDPARALVTSQALYRDYRARFGVTHWNFWEPEGVGEMAPKGLRNILRVGTPDMHGDFVERVTLARVARERRLVSGLDLGFTGLVLRSLVPVEEGGRPIGYLELGKEIGSFLKDVKRTSGNELGLLVDKAHMDEKKWTTQRAAAGLKNNWNDLPDKLLVQNTTEESDLLRFDGKIDDLPDQGLPLEVVRKGGRSLVRGVFPIRDVSGTKVGAVFVLRDISAAYDETRSAQVQAIVGVAVLMALLGGLLVAVFHLLVVRRLRSMIDVATRVVGGDFDRQIVPSAQDEIGEFETLFEQFRMLFVELIGHTQRGATGTGGHGGR